MVAKLEKLLQEVLGEKVLLCRRKKLAAPLRNTLRVLWKQVVVCSAWVTNILQSQHLPHPHLFKVVLAGGLSEAIQLLAVSKQPVFLLCTAVEHVSLDA